MAIRREVKVGAFVFLGLLVASMVIFLIGDEKRMFESKAEFHSIFTDVQGLKPGSPVRMGGIDIGQVSKVAYGADPADTRLHVTIIVVHSEAARIRKNSVASIVGRGLLGDKMFQVTIGDPKEPPIPEGGTIPSEAGDDFTAIFDRLNAVSVQAEAVMRNLEKTTGTFADPQFRADVQQGVHSFSQILKTIDEGDGYVSRLLRDGEEAKRISETMAHLEQSTGRLDETMAGVNQAIARVNHGPGFAHDVIYGDGPNEAITQFGRAADEVAVTLKGIREGDGLARGVLYGGGDSELLVQNLNDMSKDMKEIVARVRAGKGTLGALLVDPSVYEDLKLLLGNVERNKALRALVRYSITRDEKVEPVRVVDPTPSAPPAGGGDKAAER